MKNIISEEKRIKMLVLNDGTLIENCSDMSILPYNENGQMAPVVWFKVRKKGVMIQRVNGTYVQQIIYEEIK